MHPIPAVLLALALPALGLALIACKPRRRPWRPVPVPQPTGDALAEFRDAVAFEVSVEVEQHAYWLARSAAVFARWGDPSGLKREALAAAHSLTAGTFPEEFGRAAVCVEPAERRRLLLAALAYGDVGGEAEWHAMVGAALTAGEGA